jgi:hypothetical protein
LHKISMFDPVHILKIHKLIYKAYPYQSDSRFGYSIENKYNF